MEVSQLVCTVIENALNRYLALDPEAAPRFSAIEGKLLAIELKGLSSRFYIFPSADKFMVLSDFDGDADVIIRGTPLALAKLGMAEDARDVLFSGEVEIEGDSRLANQFSYLLSKTDIDWQELMSKFMGDMAAHKLSNHIQGVTQWFKRASQSVQLDTAEYLQEEVKLSPANAEIRAYINGVDELREAVDRLEAKIQQLKSSPKIKTPVEQGLQEKGQ